MLKYTLGVVSVLLLLALGAVYAVSKRLYILDSKLIHIESQYKEYRQHAELALNSCKKQVTAIKSQYKVEKEVDIDFDKKGDPEMLESLGSNSFSELLEPTKKKICTRLCATYVHIEPKIEEEKVNDKIKTNNTCYFDGIGWHLPDSTYRMQQ